MAFLYPWGNTQQLNLDWILQKIKELEAGTTEATIADVAEALISASYSRQAYERSDIVFHDGKLYRANQAIPAPGEVWTPAHWDEILLGDTVSNLVQYVAALSNDQIVNSSSVSGAHTSDALDTLKNAIDGITLDSDSVSNESQVTGDNVSDALDTLKDAIDGITLDSDSVSNESQVTGDNVSDALDTLENAITAINTALTPQTGVPTTDADFITGASYSCRKTGNVGYVSFSADSATQILTVNSNRFYNLIVVPDEYIPTETASIIASYIDANNVQHIKFAGLFATSGKLGIYLRTSETGGSIHNLIIAGMYII